MKFPNFEYNEKSFEIHKTIRTSLVRNKIKLS